MDRLVHFHLGSASRAALLLIVLSMPVIPVAGSTPFTANAASVFDADGDGEPDTLRLVFTHPYDLPAGADLETLRKAFDITGPDAALVADPLGDPVSIATARPAGVPDMGPLGDRAVYLGLQETGSTILTDPDISLDFTAPGGSADITSSLDASVLPDFGLVAADGIAPRAISIALDDLDGGGLLGSGDCLLDTAIVHFSESLDAASFDAMAWAVDGTPTTGGSITGDSVFVGLPAPLDPSSTDLPTVAHAPDPSAATFAATDTEGNPAGAFTLSPTPSDLSPKYDPALDFVPCMAGILDLDEDDAPETVRLRFPVPLAGDDQGTFSHANSDADLETIRSGFTITSSDDATYDDGAGHPLALLRGAETMGDARLLDLVLREPDIGILTDPSLSLSYAPTGTDLLATDGGALLPFGPAAATDGTPPLIVDVRAVDVYNSEFEPYPDDLIDGYEIDFSEVMDPDTFRLADWTIPDADIIRLEVLSGLRTFRLVLAQDEQALQDPLPDLQRTERTCDRSGLHAHPFWAPVSECLADEARNGLKETRTSFEATFAPYRDESVLPASAMEVVRARTLDTDDDRAPDHILIEFNTDIRDEGSSATHLERRDWMVGMYGDASDHPVGVVTHLPGIDYGPGTPDGRDDRFLFLELATAPAHPDATIPLAYDPTTDGADHQVRNQRGRVLDPFAFVDGIVAKDGIKPRLLSIEAEDGGDGTYDHYRLNFDEPVDGDTVRLQGWHVQGRSFNLITHDAPAEVLLHFHPDDAPTTADAVLPEVAYQHPGSPSTPLTDAAGNILPESGFGETLLTGVGYSNDAVHVLRAEVHDLDGDAAPDTIGLVLDRLVRTSTSTQTLLHEEDWTVGTYGPDGHPRSISLGAPAALADAMGLSHNEADRTLVLAIDATAPDTAANIPIGYAPSSEPRRLRDHDDRLLADISGLVPVDAVNPVIMDLQAVDLDLDGLVEAFAATFSEPVTGPLDRMHWKIDGARPFSVAWHGTDVLLGLEDPADTLLATRMDVDFTGGPDSMPDLAGNPTPPTLDLPVTLDVDPLLMEAVSVFPDDGKVLLRSNVGLKVGGHGLTASELVLDTGANPAAAIVSVVHGPGDRISTVTLDRALTPADEGVVSFDVLPAATDADGRPAISHPVLLDIDTDPPGAVTGLEVLGATGTSLVLEWDSPTEPDIDHFQVLLRHDGDETTLTRPFEDATVQGTTLSGLTPGQTYGVRVIAVDQAGREGPEGTEVFAVTDPDNAAPAPVAFTIPDGAITRTTARIDWGEVPDRGGGSIAAYEARLSTPPLTPENFDDGELVDHTTISGGRRVFLSDLTPGTEYTLAVIVTDDQGNEAFSSTTFTTSPAGASTGPLGLVTNIEDGIRTNTRELHVEWSAADSLAYRYRINHDPHYEVTLDDALVPAGDRGNLTLSLAHGDQYFHMAAFGADPVPVQETLNMAIDLRGPSPPTTIETLSIGDGSATIRFKMPGTESLDGVTFDIAASVGPSSRAANLAIIDEQISDRFVTLEISGLVAGEVYRVSVIAIDDLGNRGGASHPQALSLAPDTTAPTGTLHATIIQDGAEVPFIVGDRATLRVTGAKDPESSLRYHYKVAETPETATTDDATAVSGDIPLRDLQPGPYHIAVLASSNGGEGPHGVFEVTVSSVPADMHLAQLQYLDWNVRREGASNVVEFSFDPAGRAPEGLQIWVSNSPYREVATLAYESAAWDAGSFTHEGPTAQATSGYLVTLYYGEHPALGYYASPAAPDDDEFTPVLINAEAPEDESRQMPWTWILLSLAGLLAIGAAAATGWWFWRRRADGRTDELQGGDARESIDDMAELSELDDLLADDDGLDLAELEDDDDLAALLEEEGLLDDYGVEGNPPLEEPVQAGPSATRESAAADAVLDCPACGADIAPGDGLECADCGLQLAVS